MPTWLIVVIVVIALVILYLFREWLMKAYYNLRYPDAVIPCAWCPQNIYPGMPITLYSQAENAAEMKQRAFPFFPQEGHKAWAGCPYCADTGADYVAEWVLDPDKPGHGKVLRHKSVYQAIIEGNAEAAVTTGPGQHELVK